MTHSRSREYNVGITWSKSGWSVFDYISVTLDGYYNDVTDKIVAFPTTYAWKMANYGKVHAAGVDVTLAATPDFGNILSFCLYKMFFI